MEGIATTTPSTGDSSAVSDGTQMASLSAAVSESSAGYKDFFSGSVDETPATVEARLLLRPASLTNAAKYDGPYTCINFSSTYVYSMGYAWVHPREEPSSSDLTHML